ncbi:hypothetical protein YC2023_094425 [Brassica napus]
MKAKNMIRQKEEEERMQKRLESIWLCCRLVLSVHYYLHPLKLYFLLVSIINHIIFQAEDEETVSSQDSCVTSHPQVNMFVLR